MHHGGEHQEIADPERGERICAKCGLVLSERNISMEYSGERAFSSEEREKRDQYGSQLIRLCPILVWRL